MLPVVTKNDSKLPGPLGGLLENKLSKLLSGHYHAIKGSVIWTFIKQYLAAFRVHTHLPTAFQINK